MSHMEGVEGVVRYQRKSPCFIAVLHSFTFCCPLEVHKMPQYFLAIFLQLHCNLLLTIVLGYRFCMFYTTLGSYWVSIHCLLHNSLLPLLFHPCHFISLYNLYFYMNISKVLIKLTKKVFPICYFAIRWSAFLSALTNLLPISFSIMIALLALLIQLSFFQLLEALISPRVRLSFLLSIGCFQLNPFLLILKMFLTQGKFIFGELYIETCFIGGPS